MCEIAREIRLARMRSVFVPLQLQFFAVGLFFFFTSVSKPGAFSPETWGEMAYRWPASWWATYGMGAASITYYGLRIPMRHRWIIVGGLAHCAQFLALSWSAAFTGGDPVIALYATIMFLPLHIWLVWEAVQYGAGR